MYHQQGLHFESLIYNFLLSFGFQVNMPLFDKINVPGDFVIKSKNVKALVDVKFFHSNRIGEAVIRTSAVLLQKYFSIDYPYKIIIVSAYINSWVKDAILKDVGVIIWDRSNITRFLAARGRDDLNETFRRMLLETQQGVDIEDPFAFIDENVSDKLEDYFITPSDTKDAPNIQLRGTTLIEDLISIPTGKQGWRSFEKKCLEILQYLFEADLSLWDTQKKTDEGLDRFDLLCRISSMDDFWRTLVDSFRTRFIVFEFKNYEDPIEPGLIYTSERYLYPNALRSVAIIIARYGYKEQTLKAAKGALRENGKLILLITQNELIKMLEAKDVGDSPNDLLSELLDGFLSSISR